MRAPWITLMPPPPHPITATDEPGFTFAVLTAAPTPVVTPQPISDATSYGTSSGIFTAQFCGTTSSSENVPVPANPNSLSSPREYRCDTALGMKSSMQSCGCPPRHV